MLMNFMTAKCCLANQMNLYTEYVPANDGLADLRRTDCPQRLAMATIHGNEIAFTFSVDVRSSRIHVLPHHVLTRSQLFNEE